LEDLDGDEMLRQGCAPLDLGQPPPVIAFKSIPLSLLLGAIRSIVFIC